MLAMERSAQIARHRALESSHQPPTHKLFCDPHADALASQVEHRGFNGAAHAAYDILATKFLDDMALQAVGLVNMDLGQEYRQVVLFGDGMDTRPYRLPWPAGTVIYMVAPPEVHDRAEAVLEQRDARVLRGCLVKRVRVDLKVRVVYCAAMLLHPSCAHTSCPHTHAQSWLCAPAGQPMTLATALLALERAGFRSDRLSVWILQVRVSAQICARFVSCSCLHVVALPHCTWSLGMGKPLFVLPHPLRRLTLSHPTYSRDTALPHHRCHPCSDCLWK